MTDDVLIEHSAESHLINKSAPIEERVRRYGRRIQIHADLVRSQNPGVDVYMDWSRVPPNLRTRNQWDDRNHRVLTCSRPAGLLIWPDIKETRDEDEFPTGFNDVVCRTVHLYAANQTKEFTPTALQLCHRKFFNIFVRPCSRERYGFWSEEDLKWKYCTGPITKGHVQSHINGTNMYAVCGGSDTHFVAIDLDLHHGDRDVFLRQLEILLSELCCRDGWHVQVANHDAGGVHLIKVVPKTSLEDLRSQLRVSLQFLDAMFPDQVRQAAAAGMKSLGKVEIYPDPSRLFRLPLCHGRTMLLDRPLPLIENSRARNKVVQDVQSYINWLETTPDAQCPLRCPVIPSEQVPISPQTTGNQT